jgi:DNA primase
MSISKAFLDEIRARVPLSDIVGKRMKLTRAGREFKGCCPFHKEKTPSFTVNDVKGFYHCFGCGAHGDSIRFLTDHDNLKFMEAVEQLAGIAGLQVPQPTQEDEKKFHQQMSLYDMMELTAKWYEQELFKSENKKILSYLMDRDLSLDSIRGFRLGLSPSDSGQAGGLLAILQKAGFSQDELIEAGLFRKSERNKGELYPFFRGRVMFPVMDMQGRVVAFGARVLPESYGGPSGKDAPKYINSPESPVFHKGRNLYGLSRARKVIGDGESVVVVEGYMDVIALHQAGFRGAVAPLGTALTETQVEELWKVMPEGGKSPVLCFDGDTAGQRAAGRSLQRILSILKPDHSARFAFLPKEHDPDSLIREEGRGAMERVLNTAIGLFDMMWAEEAKGRDLSQPETRAGFRAALIKSARDIADPTVQEFFIHEVNQKINEVFLSKPLRKSGFTGKSFFKGKPEQPGAHTAYRPVTMKATPLQSKKLLRERILIAAMIIHPGLYEEFSEQFGMIKTHNQDYGQLRQAIIKLLDEQNDLDYQAVKKHLMEAGHSKTLDAIFDQSLYLHAGFAKPDQPYDIVRQGWQDTYDRGLQQGSRSA